MTSFFPPVDRWHLPQAALDASYREMARDGQAGTEGVALWLGNREASTGRITHVVGLRGPGVLKRRDLLRIEPWLFNDLADLLLELGVCLVGQIHSHPPGCSTDLSPTDREYGIKAPDYLSLVAPDFAARPTACVEDCGVHVFDPGTGYRRMPPDEIAARICVESHIAVPFLIVGEPGNHD